MLAIPVLRSRVAPVLDWCSRLQIYPLELSSGRSSQELCLPHLPADQRLHCLREQGVTTLICGALSAEMLYAAGQLRIKVICGVAGEITEVLQSFRENRLDQPCFRLPGCRGPRCHRGGGLGKRRAWPGQRESRERRAQPPAGEEGLGERCRCPACGTTIPDKPGRPCGQLRCAWCGGLLVRA